MRRTLQLFLLPSLLVLFPSLAASAAAQPPPKQPIRGLTAMGSFKITNAVGNPDNSFKELYVHPGVYRSAVINVSWKQIEPQQGKFDFSSIDEGLRNLAKYNAKYPATPAVGKLRVFVGTNTPGWAMKLDGGPLNITHKDEAVQFPAWWGDAYRAQWKALQVALAAKYDMDPMMGEIAAASCAQGTDESFIYPKQPSDLKTMHAAGFTDAKEQACLLGATDDYSPWKLTPVDISFSPYIATDSGHGVTEDDFDLVVMKAWRAAFGERGVLSNHSLQDPISPGLKPIYPMIKQVGPPIEYQTASQGVIQYGKESNGQPGRSGAPKDGAPFMDWNKVIQNGIDFGAEEIEIWTTTAAGGQAKITMPMLQAWAAELK